MFPLGTSSDGCIDLFCFFFWPLLKIFSVLFVPLLPRAYVWFYGAKSSVLLSMFNPGSQQVFKIWSFKEPARQPATLPSLANLENANVWKEDYVRAKDPGNRGRGKQMRREPQQNFIHEFVRL